MAVSACTMQKTQDSFRMKERSFNQIIELPALDSTEIQETFQLGTWKINSEYICFVTYGLTEGFLSVYSYPACEKLYDYGKIGQGPNEFITLMCGEANSEDMLLYDIMGRKIVQLSIGNDSVRISKTLPLYNDVSGMCKPFTYISQIEKDKYLMKVDDVETSVWEIADLKKGGKVLDTHYNMLRKENTSYTPFDFIQCISDSMVMVAYKYMDRIELYSIADDKMKAIFALGSEKDQSDLKSYNNLMEYYISIASHSGLFYCLKSNDGTNVGNIVEVYDNNANCSIKYMLEKGVNAIKIDKGGVIVGYFQDIDRTVLYKFFLQ